LATVPTAATALRAQQPTVPVIELAATPHPSKYDQNTGILPSENTFDKLFDLATGANAVLIGPGLGRDPELTAFVRKLVKKIAENDKGPKLVLDADALFAFSGDDLFELPRKYPIVLTPHPVELERLTGTSDPTSGRAQALTLHNFTLVAKGPDTHILSEGRYDLDEQGPPSLATAGSGDVLAGMLVALLAQGLKRHEASVCAVRLQALAALAAEDEMTPLCVNARDLIDYIPVAAAELLTAAERV
jgi:NAD(P)H-hydrate epimerase